MDGRSLRQRALKPDLAAVQFDDASGNRQSQARSRHRLHVGIGGAGKLGRIWLWLPLFILLQSRNRRPDPDARKIQVIVDPVAVVGNNILTRPGGRAK